MAESDRKAQQLRGTLERVERDQRRASALVLQVWLAPLQLLNEVIKSRYLKRAQILEVSLIWLVKYLESKSLMH
jgi:hypothetical protein